MTRLDMRQTTHMARISACWLLTFVILSHTALTQRRPNVVFILADDLGYGDVSCLNPKSKIRTVHIDRMAKEGTGFTDAHSPASLCTPTRYGILTGRYAWRGTLKSGVSRQFDPPLIEKDRYTVGRLFQEQGYVTACIGKWHLGWEWPLGNGGRFSDSIRAGKTGAEERLRIQRWLDLSRPLEEGPLTRGFDRYFGDDVPNYPPYCFIENDRTVGVPTRYKPDSVYGHPGLMADGWRLEEVMPSITGKAVGFIREQARSGQPFFLYFALTSPHVPIAPSQGFRGRSGAGAYGDFVLETDWAVGEVMRALDESGVDGNTLVVFTSDNGSPGQDGTSMAGSFNSVRRFGHEPNGPWRGMKTDLWEGGHRVPFLVRWPGVVRAGRSEDATVCQTDFLATCADILGKTTPVGQAVDSYSLWPLLGGRGKAEYARPFTIHHSSEGRFAIRQGVWKFILSDDSGGGLVKEEVDKVDGRYPEAQLYDLSRDPSERRNLIYSDPQKADALRRLLERAMQVQD